MIDKKGPKTNPKFRLSLRPTIAVDRLMEEPILEAVHSVFAQHGLNSIDLEALVYFTLTRFNVTPSSYKDISTRIRRTIMKHYAIEQGELIPPNERPMRRVNIVFTIEHGKE